MLCLHRFSPPPLFQSRTIRVCELRAHGIVVRTLHRKKVAVVVIVVAVARCSDRYFVRLFDDRRSFARSAVHAGVRVKTFKLSHGNFTSFG